MLSRTNRHGFSCLAFFIALVTASLGTTAYAAAGRTPGTFAVSPSGAATYTIPIWAPPGPNGLQPNIALSYSSQAGNGSLGVGWQLSGLSSIYRCNLTYAQDGVAAPVSLSASDRFCLDGRRLRLTSGTYGTAGSTYQTEITNFSNVTAYGSAGNGPAYFAVQTPDGRTYEYGNGNNSRVLANGTTASVWYLDKVTDKAGNTMAIAYAASSSNLEGLTVPTTISWTPTSHGATSYAYTMTFVYQTISTAPKAGYLAGTAAQSFYLMTNIQIAYSGTMVKNYVLTYAPSGTTGRQTLSSVQECADAAKSNCLLPTTMSLQAGAAGVGGGTTLGNVSGVISTAFDLNGDGINDVVTLTSPSTIQVAFGGATGYGALISAPAGSGFALGDLDGSGVAGLLINVSDTWYYYKWNGSAFIGTSTGISFATATSPILADVDGDGRADFVYTDSTGIVHVRLSTSTAGTVSFGTDINSGIGSANFSIGAQFGGSNRALHFWGGAQADLLGTQRTCARYSSKGICIAYQYIYYELHFTGSSFYAGGVNASAIDFADYNDDGCTDILTATQLYLSTCNGNSANPVALPAGVTAVGGMDWDGDGRRDVLVAQSNGYLGVVLSTGTGIASTVINTSFPTANNHYIAAPNLAGDGQDGLLEWNGTSATYYLHGSTGAPPDLLVSIADGYGNSVSPSYVSLPRSMGSTYFPFHDGQYPYLEYYGPIYLTSHAVFSDPSSPSGGTYYQNYFYSGMWLNLQGRGLTPQGNVQTYDSRNGVWDTKAYGRAFPYTGMFTNQTKTTNNSSSGMLFNFSSSTVETLVSNVVHQEVHFPYLSNTTIQNYELGTPTTRAVNTTTTAYTYDNYGNVKTINRTVTDNDSSDPLYYNHSWTANITNTTDPSPSTGCLNLLTQTQIAYKTSSGDTPVTRTKQFTPDLTNCRYTEIVTEPSSSTYKVTEDLGYDGFGNVNSDTVTGVGMTARTTTTTWSNSTYTTGQLPLSVTDPSGATTQFAYNYSFGQPGSSTDPNGETTSWQYNAFGLKIQEKRPDGTSTAWAYNLYPNLSCNSFSSCGLMRSEVNKSVLDTSGKTVGFSLAVFDPVDRPYNVEYVTLTGAYSVVLTNYDSLGRVASRSEPFLGSATQYFETYSYDLLNRLTHSQRPISSTNSTLETTNYTYSGDTTTVTDPQNNAKTLITDPNGWLRESKDAYGYAIAPAYDAAGSKTSVTDSLGNTLWSGSYAYGVEPYLLGFTDKDLGSWGPFTVDALGENTAWTDAKGQHFTETYDALSRPLTRSEPDLFTQWTWGATPSAHNVGMLQSVCTGLGTNPTNCTTSPGYSESEVYDSVGRPYQKVIQIPSIASPNSGTYTYSWGYSATTGLLDTMTYPVSTNSCALVVKYGYSNGQLASLTDASSSAQCGSTGTVFWTANTENARGQVTQATLGNGAVVNSVFDEVTGWVQSIQAGSGGGTGFQNQAYLYDEVGNVTQRQDNNLGLTENFYYDNVYRLDHSTLNGTVNLQMGYASTGNITSKSDVSRSAWT